MKTAIALGIPVLLVVCAGKPDANAPRRRGLINYGGADGFKTQPSGNSGARVACAVIWKSVR